MKAVYKDAKILIVDDEKANARFLEIILQEAGWTNVYSTTDSREALPLCHAVRPDILLLDLHMPHIDGMTLMRQLKHEIDDLLVPVLVLTADTAPATKHRALKGGAHDFLTKPLDETEVLLRINNLLDTHFRNIILEEEVRKRTQALEDVQLEILQRLACAAEYRDDATGLHTKRVGLISARIAEAMGLPAAQIKILQQAAPLHDVGKIAISDSILLKPAKLTQDEFKLIKSHTVIGAEILAGSTAPCLQVAEQIALTHHERWDGRGYPYGLAGEEIPIEGRIVAVADVFDALTHDRPYKQGWSVEFALAEIKDQVGRRFDKQVVEAFLTLPHDQLL